MLRFIVANIGNPINSSNQYRSVKYNRSDNETRTVQSVDGEEEYNLLVFSGVLKKKKLFFIAVVSHLSFKQSLLLK